ncbi:lipopolysaccharide biosynthesis protein [Modestobacter sp. URMC 112]
MVVASLPYVTATVVSPVLAYQLGPRGLGLLASAIAVHQVLLVVAVLGLDQALILQRVEDGDDQAARGLVMVGIATATVVTVVVGVTGPLWSAALGFDGFDPLVLATVLWTTPAATVFLVLALLTGQDRLRAYSVISFLSTVGSQVVGLVLLFTVHRSAQAYAWGGVAGQVVAMAVGVALVRPRWRGLLDLPVLRRAVRFGLPLMIGGLSRFILDAGDRVVVQRLLGPVEAGRYQVGYTVGAIAVTVVMLTNQAWAARIAEVTDAAERLELIGRSRDALYAAFAPMVVGTVLGAPLVLRLVAPASFRPSSLLAVVLLVVLSGIPVVASLASGRALIIARRVRPLAVATGAAAVVNIGLNLLLVPHWGLLGSAGATTVAFTLQAVLQRLSLPAGTQWPRPAARPKAVLTIACSLAAASVLLPQDPAWIAVRTGLALLCIPWLLSSLRRARSPVEGAG